jgi:hypothetical protein
VRQWPLLLRADGVVDAGPGDDAAPQKGVSMPIPLRSRDRHQLWRLKAKLRRMFTFQEKKGFLMPTKEALIHRVKGGPIKGTIAANLLALIEAIAADAPAVLMSIEQLIADLEALDNPPAPAPAPPSP